MDTRIWEKLAWEASKSTAQAYGCKYPEEKTANLQFPLIFLFNFLTFGLSTTRKISQNSQKLPTNVISLYQTQLKSALSQNRVINMLI